MPESGPTTHNASAPGPREVAGYRLLRRVGEGGMSTVYLSYDVAAARPVAVKLLADHLTHSPEFVARFYREARLSRLLSHPNLIRGFAAGYDPAAGKHYLILEFIDGPSAHTVLARDGCFPVGVVVQIGIDIARALAFLHSRHYVHRDVKPDNILLHPDGVARLADLGLTKRLNDDPQLTAATQGVGTPYYMAYEQALNPALVDGRSDIFALGATLYHLLSGAVPFPGRTQEEVIRAMREDTFRPLRERNPAIPAALADIINATLARDPRTRFQSAAALVDALEATGLATPIPAYAVPGQDGDPETATRADLQALPRDGPTGSAPSRPTDSFLTRGTRAQAKKPVAVARRRFWFILGGVALVAATVVGGIVAAQRTPAPPVPPVPVPATADHDSGPSAGGLPPPVPQ